MAFIQKQVEKAVSALFRHEEIQKKQVTEKSDLFEDDSSIFLQVTMFKVPAQGHVKPRMLRLAHSLWEGKDVCLFVRDPQKEWRALLAQQNIKLAKVISLKKLRANFKAYEQKRKLALSYDVFLCDEACMGYMPKLLGVEFFRRKKNPYPVKLSKEAGATNAANIARALNSTPFITKNGTCTSIRVGRVLMSPEEVVENINITLEHLPNLVAKKWDGIQSLYLKSQNSVALPLYAKLPDSGTSLLAEPAEPEKAKILPKRDQSPVRKPKSTSADKPKAPLSAKKAAKSPAPTKAPISKSPISKSPLAAKSAKTKKALTPMPPKKRVRSARTSV